MAPRTNPNGRSGWRWTMHGTGPAEVHRDVETLQQPRDLDRHPHRSGEEGVKRAAALVEPVQCRKKAAPPPAAEAEQRGDQQRCVAKLRHADRHIVEFEGQLLIQLRIADRLEVSAVGLGPQRIGGPDVRVEAHRLVRDVEGVAFAAKQDFQRLVVDVAQPRPVDSAARIPVDPKTIPLSEVQQGHPYPDGFLPRLVPSVREHPVAVLARIFIVLL